MFQDVLEICDLSICVYKNIGMYGYLEGVIIGQINYFLDGQFVIIIDKKIVGYCVIF